MSKLILVPLRMVSPDVLDLESVPTAPACIVDVVRRHAGLRLDEVRHPGQQPVYLPAVHPMQTEALVALEGLRLGLKPPPQYLSQIVAGQTANLAHYQE